MPPHVSSYLVVDKSENFWRLFIGKSLILVVRHTYCEAVRRLA
jgi:hypothetical protein